MSPRTEEQNAHIKNKRKEQILSAALKVFARRGFANTKIGDIAVRAGVSYGLVYHYFGSKEEVFSELLHRAIMGTAQSLAAAEKMEGSPIEKLRGLAQAIISNIGSYEDAAFYFMIVIHAAIMESPKENREFMEGSAESAESIVKIIIEGQKMDEIHDGDPCGLAMAFSAAIQGLAIYKLTIKDFVMPDPEILVNMLKKP
jgi:AcrR family transcriptional regulator